MHRIRFKQEVSTSAGTVPVGTEGKALRTFSNDDGNTTEVDLGRDVLVLVPTEALENLDG